MKEVRLPTFLHQHLGGSMQDPSAVNPYASPAEAFDPVQAFGSRETLLKVAQGLHLIYWGVGVILLSTMGGAILIAAMPLTIVMAQRLTIIISVGVLLGVVVGMVGRIMCLKVPEETNARPMIIGAVTCDLLGIMLAVVQWVTFNRHLTAISQLVQLAASVMFVLFLKRVALFLREQEVAFRAQSLIYMGLAAMGLAFFVFLSMLVDAPSLGGFSGLALLVVALFAFLRYVRLLHDLRQAILRPTS